jgi:beta-galactosidase/beta-glucuronidase
MLPRLHIDLAETHLWEIGDGKLYDLKLELLENGEVIDNVESYFGLRSVELREKAMYIKKA